MTNNGSNGYSGIGSRAGAPNVPRVCQNAMFFGLSGLALNEKQNPQITENTEK